MNKPRIRFQASGLCRVVNNAAEDVPTHHMLNAALWCSHYNEWTLAFLRVRDGQRASIERTLDLQAQGLLPDIKFSADRPIKTKKSDHEIPSFGYNFMKPPLIDPRDALPSLLDGLKP